MWTPGLQSVCSCTGAESKQQRTNQKLKNSNGGVVKTKIEKVSEPLAVDEQTGEDDEDDPGAEGQEEHHRC